MITSTLKRKSNLYFLPYAAVLTGGMLLLAASCTSTVEDSELVIDPVEPPAINGLEGVKLPANLPSQVKEYTGFTLSFNSDNKTPNYVSWELLGEEVQYDIDRSDNFWQDTSVTGCPTTKDYTNSGYDRGHMCPAADQKWSQQAMYDCFVMANICPQVRLSRSRPLRTHRC